MIVLDTSAAIDMIRKTPDAIALQALMLENEKVISCDLMRAEAASVARKSVRNDRMTPQQAEAMFEKALALVDEFYPLEELQTEALKESIRLQHPTYDLFYFILARRTGATVFTLDRKLMDLCIRNGVECVWEYVGE